MLQTLVQRRIGAFLENLYNFGQIDLLDIGVFLSKKWPSEASNHQKNPLRGLYEGYALSGAKETFIDLEGGAPETSIFYENPVKNDIFTVLRWFSPPRVPRGWTPGQVLGGAPSLEGVP